SCRRRARARREPADHQAEFGRAAAPAVLTPEEPEEPLPGEAPAPEPEPPPPARHVHRVRGPRTPDHRTRVLELTMPAAPVLARAKGEGVAMSMYLPALLFQALRHTGAGAPPAPTLTASVPVNLRQVCHWSSARNF